jgi:hypothetical protein
MPTANAAMNARVRMVLPLGRPGGVTSTQIYRSCAAPMISASADSRP